MCLCSSSLFPKISRKPKRVKRVLMVEDGGLLTPCLCHKVEFTNGRCVIKSRVPWWRVLFNSQNWMKNVCPSICGEGVHSLDVHMPLDERASNGSFGIINITYEAEIPAWTPYWVDIDGLEYASAKLVIYDKKFKEEKV